MAIESKDKKKTSPAARIEFTEENLKKWINRGFFPGVATATALAGAWPLAALFAGAGILLGDLEMKDKHPMMDKVGDMVKSIFGE